ncbi:hybrid sensor histidine kinase/response regulator transcription factor [Winogradskyella forsetii]|uniref:hybrid sensor histidine kinase/response regulator transcription factor n=1 Tax=Winogradskyella forsetii TaxID=2686077 RepID=UPI0015BD9041|nr:ATP-binding protein [Winogradskyella forsetii]
MKYVWIVFSLLLPLSFYAQENDNDYVVEFITTKQGLSHNYASSIVSDDLNMKWVGTENGITKFNGYDFEYIKPSAEFKGLLNENIEVLFMDKSSNLWIGTKSGGLAFLDVKNNQVKNFNHLIDLENAGDMRVTALNQDHHGNIWIGTWGYGVFVIDVKNNQLKKHFTFNQAVYSIKPDFNGDIWFCSGNRLHQYKLNKDEMTTYNLPSQITDILPDQKRNKLWVALSGKDTKLYNFDFSSSSIKTIETKVISNFSRKISLDKFNRIWMGTWGNGIYRSNTSLDDFKKIDIKVEGSEKPDKNYNTILDVHHDKNNITWLATANGGVVKLLEGNGFKNADNYITNNKLKSHLNCSAIYKDKDQIFIGTLNGLFSGKDFLNLTQFKALGNVKINTLYRYENQLFIGTALGFYIYNFEQNKITFSSEQFVKVTSFLIKDGTLYIGTQQNGLAIVPLKAVRNKNAYKVYSKRIDNKLKLESDRVTAIKTDSNNNIWVSTYNGLHLLEPNKNKFKHQSNLLDRMLPSVIINAMEIEASYVWLATPNGLIKLEYKSNKLQINQIITKKDGLNSDFICALAFDESSNLWLSTHTEIVKYNESDKSITSYGEINGVRSTSFNNNSFYNGDNGHIYFGGIDNITFFEPESIKNFSTIPEVIFTSLRVNNQIIQYKPGNFILDKNFNYAQSINLTHQQNFFSTRFTVNDFLGNLNVKYKYLLEGYQNQWIDLQSRNEINFAGLSPGNYILKVKASRDNQNWSQPQSINIKLTGSPWLSMFALILYGLILISITIYFVKSNNYKLKLKNNLEITRIDKEKEAELAEAKLNFFTNISHEFRTPLTLIISPLKELLEYKDLPQKVYKNLNYIDKNTSRLQNLINQLLDFRKADHGLLKLDVSYGNFVRFSNEVHLYFKEAAKTKNIKYKFKSSSDEILFPFDRNKMEIVLCNLLSNALKYTSTGDQINIKVKANNQYCFVTIKDTGIGMDQEDMENIFDRFFQIKSSNTASLIGSGIGLSFSKKIIELHHGSISVKSEVNVGTKFTIRLPLDASLYGSDININFIKTDNIKGYNTEDIVKSIENLNTKAKAHSVLIIDDNTDILDYLNDILSEDYDVIQAENGISGFEKASTEIPDLIISDVMMPGKDGITLCKELKSQITTSHIPIILLTARTSTVFEIEGLKTGADDYITKPFNSNIIKARITSILENREKLRTHLLNKVRFEPTQIEIEKGADAENTFINKAILLVENNMHNSSFGIETMVDELHMSQSTLFRKIKSLTGLSLTAFIRSVRLKKAAYLIISSELNLNEIAYEVGFNDYKYFKTSFKKQFDCLPSKYKSLIND